MQLACEGFYLRDTLPRHLASFAKLLEADPSSPWLCGGPNPTIADFLFAPVVKHTFVQKTWSEPVELPPAVQANIDAFYALPSVLAWKKSEGCRAWP